MPVKLVCPDPDCAAEHIVDDENIGELDHCKMCGTQFPLAPLSRDGGPQPFLTSDLGPKTPALPSPKLIGKYQILKLLGQGSMGLVYLAFDPVLKRQVALKVPLIGAIERPEVRDRILARFLREAEAAARFIHPNFCPLFEWGEVDGAPFLTMQYIEGEPLSVSIELGKGWPPRKAAEDARRLAAALAVLHQWGIIHRDLKPGNIMVKPDGGLVIMDFGLAMITTSGEEKITKDGEFLGTPAFVPPEQAKGDLEAIGPRSDVYSLGVILYQLLTGRLPFEGNFLAIMSMILNTEPPPPPSKYCPDLDPQLDAICLKAMAKKPVDRHGSMDKFAGALKGWLDATEESGSLPAHSTDTEAPTPLVRQPGESHGEPLLSKNGKERVRNLIVVSMLSLSIIMTAFLYIKNFFVNLESLSNVAEIRKPPEKIKPVAKPLPPPRAGDTLFTNSIGMTLKLIPAGGFNMGSNASDDAEADGNEKVNNEKHPIQISKPFYLGRTEVTVAQFRQFVESTKPAYKTDAESDGKGGFGWNETKRSPEQDTKYHWRSTGFDQTDDHPVVNVSWRDAVAFCNWLSESEGRIPCYDANGAIRSDGNGYRLPTEAEWEYCCRAGTVTRYWSGDDANTLATETVKVGNVADMTAKEKYPSWKYAINGKDGSLFTAPVGKYKENSFGLCDMHGNVWEWCWDYYDSNYYSVSPSADPRNSTWASNRVFRGGSWYNEPRYGRSANRGKDWEGFRTNDLGFRVARVK